MSEDYATWTGEPPEPETRQEPAEFTAAPASWLPASVLRRQAIEDRAEAREARQAEQERKDRAEQRRDGAVAAYMAEAAARGESFSALDAVNGNLGRSVGDVLSGATSELADRIPPHLRGPADAEICVAPVRRARPLRDGDGMDVIDRALIAYERRRVDKPGKDAAEALEASRARRGPQAGEFADAWADWRRR